MPNSVINQYDYDYDYFYEGEAEQFVFLRIPKALFEDERLIGLSSDAKLLFGLFIDRLGLSRKNGWVDKNGRVFVYFSVEDIQEKLKCSEKTCRKILKELDTTNGVGLIERVKQGMGRPDIIYVKDFIHKVPHVSQHVSKPDSNTEVKKLPFMTGKNYRSCPVKITVHDRQNLPPNNNNINNNKSSNIYPSIRTDGQTDDRAAYSEIIKENINYDWYMASKFPDDNGRELFDELYQVMLDVVTSSKKSFRINGTDYPGDVVRSQFLKLNYDHLDYVIDRISSNIGEVKDIKSYMMTALFNAPMTINTYYTQRVRHDMYGEF